ncbi:type III-B CRISPR module RAMP protein Cmr4 [Oscillatoria sp. FACHB-1406]|uniref:type III-B CRISPR module RAMP protein Cmr4 n=1 Tax=Oscillatoria sp. FACHB-1406 TaxID=2692846 RepID=UPI001688ACB7|nr:type III-B CRISPR module RAMP protein Cmr4 [Oscillatoria sp. FACHB-1406]MBD2580121.1 type III-B CRISPR module RAMP protein Cmr4 [Oscillatoria sp. FACHB-1406]
MSKNFLTYLYLLSPLHTGGTAQEGNVVGIAREAHTNFPYLPSSSTRGKLRAEVDFDPQDPDAEIKARIRRIQLFGPDLKDLQDSGFLEYYEMETDRKLAQLEQGSIWIGDASILWLPVPSISHGVIWISCPLLLQRWTRQRYGKQINVEEYSSNLPNKGTLYLKDATIPGNKLVPFPDGKTWNDFVPNSTEMSINSVLVVPNRYCETLIEMSLWRQVKVKLNEYKVVTDGSFRYEEAIPPDTLMYFPWGELSKPQNNGFQPLENFKTLLAEHQIIQFGGQESLGRGFVRQWTQTD